MKLGIMTRHLLLAVSAALSLTSCAEPIIPRQQVFHVPDYTASQGRGSATIAGRVFVTMRDNSERIGAHEQVELVAVTPYTEEIMEVEFTQSRTLSPSDPRFQKYIRSTQTDDQGRFAFHGLPAGEYFVTSNVEWEHWFWNDDLTQKVYVHDTVPIHSRVAVKGGQAVAVSDWIYGRTIAK